MHAAFDTVKEMKFAIINNEVCMSQFKKVLPLILMVSLAAYAQEKKKETTEVKATAETKTTDEADEVITNRKLRAESGSLSKWSASTSFDYSGGSVADPLNPERPNITAGRDVLTFQNFSGSLGIRYRISTFDSITASTGFFISTPFHDKLRNSSRDPVRKKAFDDTNRELNVNDPAVRYTHLHKIFGVQSVTTVSGTLITNNQLEEAGYESYWDISQNFLYDIGKTGASVGVLLAYGFYTHSKDDDSLATNNAGLYPMAEYVINDTFNLRTIFGQWVYQQDKSLDHNTWDKLKVYQSVGLGISVTRDIFLYPNIQFIPSDIRSDRTNIAISASVNVF